MSRRRSSSSAIESREVPKIIRKKSTCNKNKIELETLKEEVKCMKDKIDKISKCNEKLVSENKKLQLDLNVYKEGYMKFVDIHSVVHKQVSNVLNVDMPHDQHCLVCLKNGDTIKLNTGTSLLKLECSDGACQNMMCCKDCFETYDRSYKVCMFCRKPGSFMTICDEIIDLS
jgi:hypothetical protein